MPPSPKRITDELWRAREQRRKPSAFDLGRVLFEKQLPFGLDTARFQTACCTRRSGKTVGLLAKLLKKAESTPGSVCLYITLSRINAKRLAWDILKTLNAEHDIGGEANESELCLTLPNGARLYLTGCADMGEVEKFRGLPLAMVVIDEAQSFPTLLLQKLIDEVLTPALMDFAGILVLVGTPGPVPVGYFHRACHNLSDSGQPMQPPQWSQHSWTVFDNPWIERKSGQTPQQLLAAELARRGVTLEDPVIQREWFRRWVTDPSVLVFKFDAKANTRAPREHTSHVIGVDLGFHDADAIAVLGWSEHVREVDLVYEKVMAKQTVTPLIAQVVEAYRRFKPLAVVMDTAGAGKKIAEEITQRFGIPVDAADKMRRFEHIEWVNDALRTHSLFVPAESRFAQDALLVEWDKSDPLKLEISERFHSDIAFAVLYAYVEALHWLEPPKPVKPPPLNSPEWHAWNQQHQQADIAAQLERQMAQNRDEQRDTGEPLDFL